MIIVRLSGGLGNQMFQYAFGYAKAKYNKTNLKIDISGYNDPEKKRLFELNNFTISAPIASIEDFKTIGIPYWSSKNFFKKVYRILFKIIDKNKPICFQKIFFENKFTYLPETKKIKKDVFLVGNWQSERYFKDIQNLIRKEFTLKTLGKSGIKIKNQIENETNIPVSIHVRHGDYMTNHSTNQKHGILPIDYYFQAYKKILQYVSNPIFYVFSDDIEWCQKNLSFLPHTIMVSDSKKFSSAEEILLMSKCTHHIIANSTFSWWGAWLNPQSKKIVIAPKHWFNKSINTKDLLPEEWFKL